MTKPKNYDLVLTRLLCIIKYLCIDERKTIKELSHEFNPNYAIENFYYNKSL